MAVALTVSTKFVAVDKFSRKIAQMSEATMRFSTKASAAMARVATASNNLSSKLFNLKGALAVLAVGMGAKKIYDLSVSVADFGDNTAEMSRRLGLTAESLQEFQYAAKRGGVENEEFIRSFKKLSRNVGDLRMQQGSLYSTLKKSDPALLSQLKNVKDNEQAFNLIVGAIEKLPNQMDKAALAAAAFGKEGITMLTMTELGTDGIAKMREEARKFGGVMSNEAAASSEAFMDMHDNMMFAMKGLKMTIGTALMPQVKGMMQYITGWIGKNKELVQQKVADFAIKIGNALMWVARNINLIITVIKFYIGSLVLLKVVTVAATLAQYAFRTVQFASNVVMGVSAALTNASSIAVGRNTVALIAYRATVLIATYAQKALNFAMKMNPIGLIILGIMALIAIIKNWSKIIDWIKKQWQKFWGPIKIGIEVFLKYWKKAGEWIRKVWDKATGWIRKLWDKAFGFVVFMVKGFIYIWKRAGEWIRNIWASVTGWISDKWNMIWGPIRETFKGFVQFFKNIIDGIRMIWSDLMEWINRIAIKLTKKMLEFKSKYLFDKTAEIQLKAITTIEEAAAKRNQEGNNKPFNADAATAQTIQQTINKNTTNTSKLEIVDNTGKANMKKKGSKDIKLTKTVGK